MTLIDLFREFSSTSTRDNYSPSSRILYYTLLWCWNEQRRPEVATMTTKGLCTLTGLPETTFREAFAYLADRGWVKRVKSRKTESRGLMAFCLRDRRELAAPPAGFPLSPAQRKSNRGVEESPNGDSSVPTQSTEAHANVREHNQQNNARNNGAVENQPPETGGSPATNAEVYDRNLEIEVPDFSR